MYTEAFSKAVNFNLYANLFLFLKKLYYKLKFKVVSFLRGFDQKFLVI